MLSFLSYTAPTSIADLFTQIGAIASGMYDMVADVLSTITGNFILCFAFLLPFALLGIKILRKLVNTRL